MSKRPYVQFSKKIVVAVNAAVFVVVLAGIVLAAVDGAASEMTAIIRIFVEYAMVVFAAYSGNSAVEKWLVKRGPSPAGDDSGDEENEGESNG